MATEGSLVSVPNITSYTHKYPEDNGASVIKFDVNLFMIGLKISIGILGILGNATVCFVLSKIRAERVNFLIGSQATIDLLASTAMVADAFTNTLFPQLTPNQPINGYLFCLLWRWATVTFCLFSASTYNLIAISVERYLAIIHPMWHRVSFTKKKAVLLAITAWLFSPIMQIAFAATQEFYSNGKCVFKPNPALVGAIIGIILFIWDFVMPSMIMGFCSARICLAIIAHSRNDNGKKYVMSKDTLMRKSSTLGRSRRNRNVSITFVVVVIAYITCWSTDQFLFLHRNLGGHQYHRDALFHFSNAMAMLNSAINPLIYVFCMKKYREKLKTLVCWCPRRDTLARARKFSHTRSTELSSLGHQQLK